jgi:hypothetical protein
MNDVFYCLLTAGAIILGLLCAFIVFQCRAKLEEWSGSETAATAFTAIPAICVGCAIVVYAVRYIHGYEPATLIDPGPTDPWFARALPMGAGIGFLAAGVLQIVVILCEDLADWFNNRGEHT